VRNAETASRNCARISSRSDFLDTAIGSTPFLIFYSNYTPNFRGSQVLFLIQSYIANRRFIVRELDVERLIKKSCEINHNLCFVLIVC
jgi:hypothetical protein